MKTRIYLICVIIIYVGLIIELNGIFGTGDILMAQIGMGMVILGGLPIFINEWIKHRKEYKK